MTIRKRKGRYCERKEEAIPGEVVLEEAMDLS
jgi:hypothetical protein